MTKKEAIQPTKVYIKEKDARNGWAIYTMDGGEYALGFGSKGEAEIHCVENDLELCSAPQSTATTPKKQPLKKGAK